MAKKKVFGVFGLGIFGMEVCRTLAAKGLEVIAIDKDSVAIEKAKNIVSQAILIDSTDEDALRNAPIDDIDVAIVGVGENIEVSILTTALLRKLGVTHIIARAGSDIHAQVLTQIGANEVINIELEEGARVANRLISPDIKDKIYVGKNQVIAEVTAPRSFIGKSIVQLDLRKRYNINIISIKRIRTDIDDSGLPSEEEIMNFPSPDLTLKKDDVLVVVGSQNDIEDLKD
ncbi:MAG: TrkA family potassium uptake protein [Candidatus Neomarinimicrobiota bacterium]